MRAEHGSPPRRNSGRTVHAPDRTAAPPARQYARDAAARETSPARLEPREAPGGCDAAPRQCRRCADCDVAGAQERPSSTSRERPTCGRDARAPRKSAPSARLGGAHCLGARVSPPARLDPREIRGKRRCSFPPMPRRAETCGLEGRAPKLRLRRGHASRERRRPRRHLLLRCATRIPARAPALPGRSISTAAGI